MSPRPPKGGTPNTGLATRKPFGVPASAGPDGAVARMRHDIRGRACCRVRTVERMRLAGCVLNYTKAGHIVPRRQSDPLRKIVPIKGLWLTFAVAPKWYGLCSTVLREKVANCACLF